MPSGPKKRRAAAKKKEGISVVLEESRKIQDEPIAEPAPKQEVKPDDSSDDEMSGGVKIYPVEDVVSEKEDEYEEEIHPVEHVVSEKEDEDDKEIELVKQVKVKSTVEELLKAVRKFEEALLLSLDKLNAIY